MRYATGVMLVVAAAMLWSFNGLAIRQIEVAGTWAVLFWRSLGMIPVLFGYIWWRSKGDPLAGLRAIGAAGVIGGFALVMAFAGAIFAFQATTVANAVFLFSASPILAAIFGWVILREPVHTATWAAIALAVVGMYIMVREGLAAGALAGNIAALLSAVGFAAFTITLRWGKLSDMMPAVLLGGILSMIVAGIVIGAQGGTLWVPARDIGIAMMMGAGLLATGMLLYTLGSRVISATEMTLLSMVEVLLAPIWVWVFLGETNTPATFIGGAVLMVAVVMNGMAGARRLRDA